MGNDKWHNRRTEPNRYRPREFQSFIQLNILAVIVVLLKCRTVVVQNWLEFDIECTLQAPDGREEFLAASDRLKGRYIDQHTLYQA